MNKIIVLMSTFNGERYLREQIDSIYNQECADVKLIVRDDGSSDKTLEILNEYLQRGKDLEVIQGLNLGCKGSFYTCAKYAFERYPDVQNFAFADQDDVWLPQKLYRGMERLKKGDSNIPQLYFCPPTIVDSQLAKLPYQWPKKHLLTFEESCLIQPAPGCAMVFNRKALELYLRVSYDVTPLHDAWIYKVVLACNGSVYRDDQSFILYRQHLDNVVGVKNSFYYTLTRRLKSFFREKGLRKKRMDILLNNYNELLSDSSRRTICELKEYQKIKNKLQILFSSKYKILNLTSYRLFKLSILFNRF